MSFERIRVDHRVMGGAPCVAGTRIPVAMLVRMVASGMSVEEILADYPQLTADDVADALRFAAAADLPAGPACLRGLADEAAPA